MSGIHLGWNPVDEQLESLRVLLEELRREVSELRAENAELRQQVSSLKCDVGYLCAGRDSQPRCSGIALWKSGRGPAGGRSLQCVQGHGSGQSVRALERLDIVCRRFTHPDG